MRTNTESLIDALNAQPWLIENSAASTLTYNLPLPVTPASSLLHMDGGVVPSVTTEPELPTSGPQWPDKINTETLVSELPAWSSNNYVKIKCHTHIV